MTTSIPFGRRATADQVLAGIDLTGKRIIVTGCNSGLGLETMNAFAANGAAVIGLARTLESASRACAQAGPACFPVACDLTDLDSIAAALRAIRALSVPLDAIVANAGVANLPSLHTRYGVELQFLTNHLGHFMLVNGLTDLVREGSGRIVVVSSGASISRAPSEGIMFDNRWPALLSAHDILCAVQAGECAVRKGALAPSRQPRHCRQLCGPRRRTYSADSKI